ncbi:MAG: HAMP domain-containing protein [Leptospira sp.]|nr:HAMP domain-containing protein [Leptospira sp.]
MPQSFQLSRFTIKVKLIGIISLIIIASLSLMIFLASQFFKSDSEKSIQTNNLQTVTLIGQKVERELLAIASKLNTHAILQEQKIAPDIKSLFTSLFFRDNPSFLYFAIAKKSGNAWITELESFHETQLIQKQILKENIKETNLKFADSFLTSFDGKTNVVNLAPSFLTPIMGISIPFGASENRRMILLYMDSEDFQKSFETEGINTSFMVGSQGEVLAHPDNEILFAGTNLKDIPIVSSVLSSKLDNGLSQYKDDLGVGYLGSFKKISIGNIGIVSTVEEDKAFEEVYNIQRRNIYILIIVLNISVLIVFLYSRSITSPIQKLVGATKKIESGNFQLDIKPSTKDELGLLTNSFIEMGHGLEEREKVKSILGNMIDPVVVEEAMKDMAALKRGSEKEITSFFSDVASFSSISEQLQSADLAALLNEYLSAMTEILKEHDGVLDKYIGDAIVGIFNAPVDIPHHELSACLASVKMVKKLEELRQYWQKNNLYSKDAQVMDARIGLNSGPAKVGFMGTDALASYTMMGDTVNLAARLEAAGKDYGVNILISETTYKKVKGEMFTRFVDLVRVKGKNEPVKIYELIDTESDVDEAIREATNYYEKGFQLYLDRNFKKAIAELEKSVVARFKLPKTIQKSKLQDAITKEKAVNMLIERCNDYIESPPAKDWDGVFTRTHK